MKSAIFLEILLLATVVALTSSSYVSSASAVTSYLPGVKAGDTWSYGNFLEICNSPCSPSNTPNLNNTSATVVVTNVSGSNVTVSLAVTNSTGNTSTSLSTWSVATWVGRVATLTGPPLLIAAGVGQGDHLTTSSTSLTINETILRNYGGATRQVDVVNFTRTLGSASNQRATYWDKTTGVLLEDRFANPGFFISYRLTKTSLWSPSISYLLGVKVGDYWNYGRPTGFCSAPCPPGLLAIFNVTSVANVVTVVVGSNVTIRSAISYSNGTTRVEVETGSVESGAGNLTQTPLLIASGLGPGDHIFNSPSAPTINYTSTKAYAGVVRTLNVLSITTSFPGGSFQRISYWDRLTGVGTEFSLTTPTVSIAFMLVRTNLWSGGPDFTISANPTTLTIPRFPNSTGTLLPVSTITLASVNNFTGPVFLVARVSPQGVVKPILGSSFNSTTTLILGRNGTNQTSLIPSVPPTPTPGTYLVTVTGVSGSISHSTNVTIIVQAPVCGPPQCGIEALSLQNFLFASSTSVALDLRDLGNSSITLVTYNVKDAQGDQYSNPSWTGATILANTVGSVVLLIGSSCPSCILSGSAFTFTPGNTYTIIVVTSRSNQFTFTVVPGAFAGDFTISANPSFLTLPMGNPSPGFSTITLTSTGGFSGSVTLVLTPTPPIAAFVNVSNVQLSSGSFVNIPLAVIDDGAAPGLYSVRVTGTSGSLSHSVTVTIQVTSQNPDFQLQLAAPPGGLTVQAGQSSFVSVYLVNNNPFPFNGNVTLTGQVSPSVVNGPVLSFNPAQVSFIPGPSFSAVTIFTTAFTPPGNYSITITGTSGTLKHNVQTRLTVLPPPVLTVSPSSGSLGTLVTVHGSGFLVSSGGPLVFPVELEMTFDNQFLGFVFLTNSSFDFTFNVPHADPTVLHHIHAVEPFPMSLDVQTVFTVLPEPSPPASLTVSVSTGPIYFPSDTVVVYVQTVQNGSPVSSTVQLQVIRPDGTRVTLNAAAVSTGVYKASFNVPITGSTGTYAIIASATMNGQSAVTLAAFEVKSKWLSSQSGRTTTTGLALVAIVGLLAVASLKGPWRRPDKDDEMMSVGLAPQKER